MGAVLQERTAPVWVPHGATGPASKPAAAWGSLHRVTAPARSLERLSTGCSFLQGTSTVVLHGLEGDNLRHHGLQRNLCSGAWSTSSFFINLSVFRAVSLTSSHSSLRAAAQHFLPFLKYVITEAVPPLLMGSALASDRSILELALSDTGAASGGFSQRPPLQTPATKTLPRKPNTVGQKKRCGN